jgi:hypothetical protein
MRHRQSPVPSLCCERLEYRDCPAAQILQFGGFLVVAGDAAANNVIVNDLGNGRLAVVADNRFQVSTNVHTVIIATGGGDDSVSYNLFGSASAANLVSIATGAGNDSVSLNGTSLSDSLTVGVNAGIGDDDISANLAGVPLGATVNLFLSGSAGADSFDLNAAGEVDGALNVLANGGGGVDTLSGDIDVAAGSTGSVRTILAGSFGDDFLDLSVTGAGLVGIALTAEIRGGLGFDTGVATANVVKVGIEA